MLVICICDFCRDVHAIIDVLLLFSVKLLGRLWTHFDHLPQQGSTSVEFGCIHGVDLSPLEWLHMLCLQEQISVAFKKFQSPSERTSLVVWMWGLYYPCCSLIRSIFVRISIKQPVWDRNLGGVSGASCQVVYTFAARSSVHIDPETICLPRWTWPLGETGFSDRFSFGGDRGRNKMDLQKGYSNAKIASHVNHMLDIQNTTWRLWTLKSSKS